MKEKAKNCKYCDKEMEPKTTRGQFCSDKCRVYWNRENGGLKTAKVLKDGTKVQFYVPVPQAEKVPPPKMDWIPKRPKNLLELKAMCPPDLKEFERSQWISNERQKYNI